LIAFQSRRLVGYAGGACFPRGAGQPPYGPSMRAWDPKQVSRSPSSANWPATDLLRRGGDDLGGAVYGDRPKWAVTGDDPAVRHAGWDPNDLARPHDARLLRA
jgi:hypothetical protein